MKATKMIVLVAMVAVLAGAGLAGASDWQKLGGKTIAFKDEASTFTVETKDAPVGEIKLKVSGSWVRFTNLTLSFSDGTRTTAMSVIVKEVSTPINVADMVKLTVTYQISGTITFS